MKIAVVTIAHNEEKLLPYFVANYYFADKIILIDNESTDNTPTLAKILGCEVRIYNSNGECDRIDQTHLQNQIFQELRESYDWIIFVDVDELIDWETLRLAMLEPNVNVINTRGVQVLDLESFDGSYYAYFADDKTYNKPCVVHRSLDFVFERGRHYIRPTIFSQTKYSSVIPDLYHFKYAFGLEYAKEKHKNYMNRIKKESSKNIEYSKTEHFYNELLNRAKINEFPNLSSDKYKYSFIRESKIPNTNKHYFFYFAYRIKDALLYMQINYQGLIPTILS